MTDEEDLALEVRALRCRLRDTQNRFAEEAARLNTEIAFWKLKFYEACALIPYDGPECYTPEAVEIWISESC